MIARVVPFEGMAKDRGGPKISYQVLMIPATDASVDTASYHEYGTGRFLARAFMKYGWDLYAPDAAARNNPYVSPLRASLQQLQGLPPALVVTRRTIRCATKARPTPASSRRPGFL
jgi:acetyl esterase